MVGIDKNNYMHSWDTMEKLMQMVDLGVVPFDRMKHALRCIQVLFIFISCTSIVTFYFKETIAMF